MWIWHFSIDGISPSTEFSVGIAVICCALTKGLVESDIALKSTYSYVKWIKKPLQRMQFRDDCTEVIFTCFIYKLSIHLSNCLSYFSVYLPIILDYHDWVSRTSDSTRILENINESTTSSNILDYSNIEQIYNKRGCNIYIYILLQL